MIEHLSHLFENLKWKSLILGALTMFIAPWAMAQATSAIGNYLVYPMVQAEIDATRGMLAGVPCDPQVIGYQAPIANATAFNIRIAHEQEALRHLYSRYFITRRWGSVTPIPLPCSRTPQ